MRGDTLFISSQKPDASRLMKRWSGLIVIALVALVRSVGEANEPTGTANVESAPKLQAVPATRLHTMVVRNTLAAVNHGMLTGNFTVLRDLATEDFRRLHQAGELAAAFGSLRQQKIDLSATLVTEPQHVHAAIERSSGRLLIVGSFPTRPRSIEFSLAFQRVDGGWLIDDVALSVPPAAE
jgi:hypothetical protein